MSGEGSGGGHRWRNADEGVGCLLIAVAIVLLLWALKGFPGLP